MKATTTIASSTTPDGSKMLLQVHDGQHYLRINGVTLMATIASHSEQQMADAACEEFADDTPRILIGGLGFGYTLSRVLDLVGPKAKVVVAELMPAIVAWNREFLGDVNGKRLDDPRAVIKEEDVVELIKKGGTGGAYDAILLDVDNSPDPLTQRANARLYSKRGLERIHAALKPFGRVVFWSAHRDREFARLLERIFAEVDSVSAKAYPKAKKFTHTLFVARK